MKRPSAHGGPRRYSGAWVLLVVLYCLGAVRASAEEQAGALLIAGGAVDPSNSAIFQTLLGVAPNPEDARVAIIAGASASPSAAAERMRRTFGHYGVPAERVELVRLALLDDAETSDVDESAWAGNAVAAAEIARVERADIIWIAGGDQLRLTDLLLDERGQATPMLDSLRRKLANGAVIAGTSAGAAVMSDPMIGRGESMAALLDDAAFGEPLRVVGGLGFFAEALVDQHFDSSARLGRLAVAIGTLPGSRRVGLGIDENTAVFLRPGTGSLRVLGVGTVTILDGREAHWRQSPAGYEIRGLRISVAASGDRIDTRVWAVQPAPDRSPTVGNEYVDQPARVGGGIALPTRDLGRMLGNDLLDNRAATAVSTYSFLLPASEAAAGPAVLFRFRQEPVSRGYWGPGANGRSAYTIDNVAFEILPRAVEVTKGASSVQSDDIPEVD